MSNIKFFKNNKNELEYIKNVKYYLHTKNIFKSLKYIRT